MLSKIRAVKLFRPYVIEIWNDPDIGNIQAISDTVKFISEQYSQVKDFARHKIRT